MAYRVELTARALLDIDDLLVEKQAATSPAAARWAEGLYKTLASLQTLPFRCAEAPEAKSWKRELRQLLYGRRPHVYRILFEVDQTSSTVRVLHIRHGARFVPAPSGE